MFESKSQFDYGLVFDFGKTSRIAASVHMLFVFFPIDLVFLDEQKRVVDVKAGFQPFSLNYTPKKPCRFLIELPPGLGQTVRLGDELDWKA